MKDIFTVIVGGKAGQGIRKAGKTISKIFAGMGREILERMK